MPSSSLIADWKSRSLTPAGSLGIGCSSWLSLLRVARAGRDRPREQRRARGRRASDVLERRERRAAGCRRRERVARRDLRPAGVAGPRPLGAEYRAEAVVLRHRLEAEQHAGAREAD